MIKQLIINADDYGRTKLVSAGIRSAHLNGIVTSSTTMMNMPGIENDLLTALEDCPNLGLGVHLNLTWAKPLTPIEKVPSLVGDQGLFPSLTGFITTLARISLEEVRLEWDAQISKFIQLTGRTPDHLDSHHHTSYLTPGLFKLMLESANELNCAIRIPLADGSGNLPMDLPEDHRNLTTDHIGKLILSYSPVKPDYFYSSFFDNNATVEHLSDLVRGLGEGSSEIMCHPGLPDIELEKNSTYATQRDVERKVLEDDKLRGFIEQQGIKLVNFGDL